MKIKNTLLQIIACTVICGCGGSSGGGETNYAGIWRSSGIIINSNCADLINGERRSWDFEVNQSGSRVVASVGINDDLPMDGQLIGDGFIVSRADDAICPDGSTTRVSLTVTFDDIEENTSNDFQLVATGGSCFCEFSSAGTAERL